MIKSITNGGFCILKETKRGFSILYLNYRVPFVRSGFVACACIYILIYSLRWVRSEKSKMAKPAGSSLQRKESKMEKTGFGVMNEDLLRNVFSRLPAASFASAACVSKYWNEISIRVLSRPMLVSALSINPSLHVSPTNF